MASYLVTGAGRGVGLELVSQLLDLDPSQVSKVFATTRLSPSTPLQALIEKSNGRLIHVPMVVTDKLSIDQAMTQVTKHLESKGLDVLINNAGIQGLTPDGVDAMSDLRDHFETNVEGPHNVIAAFLPLLRKGGSKKIVSMSSTLGSFGLAKNFIGARTPAYKISKAALNMLTVQYAHDLEKEGFTCIMISPGWLKTDMGSEYADLPVEVGVKEFVRIMLQSGPESNGKFFNIHVPGWENAEGPNQYPGGEVPW